MTVGRVIDEAACAGLQALRKPIRALFLDRDGVINLNHGYVHTSAVTEWVPGIFDLVGIGRSRGFLPIVVTNQAGIARGLYSEAEFREYTRWMHSQFTRLGVPLLATFFCPHHPSGGIGPLRTACSCRKPGPDMILAAADAFRVDLAASILVGDEPTDIAAAEAAGVGKAVLLVPDRAAQPASLVGGNALDEVVQWMQRHPENHDLNG